MIYTLDEVAKILKCSYLTVYNLVREEKIKSFKVGNNYRVRQEDLDAFTRGE